MDEDRENLILKLHEIGGVKFGDFKLKSGIQSPAYFDLRLVVSYPEIMGVVAKYLWKAAENVSNKYVSVCGVPYTALPLATVMSVEHNIPMLIRRREAKDYGTKKMIEGHYKDGDICLVVEDVTTSGSSVLETVQTLKDVGVVVRDAVVLLEREQGGQEKLKEEGITLHSVFTMTQMVHTLNEHKRIDTDMMNKVLTFVAENRFDRATNKDGGDPQAKKQKKEMTFKERASLSENNLSQRLFNIMEEKKSNLAVSVDLTTSHDILQLVDKVGPFVCLVKTHVDIVSDFSQEFVEKLTELATRHNFLIFEDRKFADIGNTVMHQYSVGIYKISEWADVVNAHTVPGPGVVQGLKQVGLSKGRACLLIAEMSSEGNLAKGEYTKATVQLAEENKDFVIGFICQNRISETPQMLHFTPGVQLEVGSDSLGQRYITPRDAIYTRKSDVIIVGRGITKSADPREAAKQYQEAAFSAYCERIS